MAQVQGIGSFSASDFSAELEVQLQRQKQASDYARQSQQLLIQSLLGGMELRQGAQRLGLAREDLDLRRKQAAIAEELNRSELRISEQRAGFEGRRVGLLEQAAPRELELVEEQVAEAKRKGQSAALDTQARLALAEALRSNPQWTGGDAIGRAIDTLDPSLLVSEFVQRKKQERIEQRKGELGVIAGEFALETEKQMTPERLRQIRQALDAEDFVLQHKKDMAPEELLRIKQAIQAGDLDLKTAEKLAPAKIRTAEAEANVAEATAPSKVTEAAGQAKTATATGEIAEKKAETLKEPAARAKSFADRVGRRLKDSDLARIGKTRQQLEAEAKEDAMAALEAFEPLPGVEEYVKTELQRPTIAGALGGAAGEAGKPPIEQAKKNAVDIAATLQAAFEKDEVPQELRNFMLPVGESQQPKRELFTQENLAKIEDQIKKVVEKDIGPVFEGETKKRVIRALLIDKLQGDFKIGYSLGLYSPEELARVRQLAKEYDIQLRGIFGSRDTGN